MNGAKTLRPLTPKEFSEAIGGLYSVQTIQEKCREGKLRTVNGPRRPPYFIHPSELEKYRPVLARFLVLA